jgi:hypothetical protein
VAREVVRRGTAKNTAGGEPPRDERGVGQRADAHGEVAGILHEVDVAIGQRQLDIEPWVGAHEGVERRCKVQFGEGLRAGHPQHAAERRLAATHAVLELLECAEQLASLGEAGVAGIGEAHATRRAQQELSVEARLEFAYLPADARLGTAEATRRSGEAAELGDVGESSQGLQLVHAFCSITRNNEFPW